ncbi:hypothetical protein MRB53_022825 [Persea americana]|uniref:Uncharacterized protein n=1 Tax=Persea americana TaxID=3435 RepID=A0ACC2L7P2_PERAE|nr:hypothetical protein MRB53_022825 [Persea americana]
MKSLAVTKDMKRCVGFFKLMHAQKLFDGVEMLDVVGESLCCAKLVAEARNLIVLKLKSLVKPSATTYGFLVHGVL